MFCPNCGAQNPDGTPKCTTCGQVLQSAGARPQAKFKGTMLMTHEAAPPVSPRGPSAAPPPPAGKGQFAKTMLGGMASFDPASLGGGMIAPHDEGNQVEAARTIAMDAGSFGLPTAPQGSGGPSASPFPGNAPAPSFAQRPMAPPPPREPEPEPAPVSSTDEEMGVASTIAVDSSSFGFDRDLVPGPGPASFHQAPQHQPPQGGFGQAQPPQHQAPQGGFGQPPPQPQQAPQGGFGQQQPPQNQAPQGGFGQQPQAPQGQGVSSSTVAMDASAFGLGGPGGPMGGFGQQPQQQPQGGFGQQPQQQPQGGFGQQPQQQPQGPGGPNMFAGLPQNEPGGIASTLAVDASAFGLGGMAGPGGPGMPPQGGFGQQQQGGYGQQQQGGYGMQPGMQQGGYGMQPGYGQQPGFGPQQGGYGQQPGMQPYGAPPAAKSGKTGLIIGVVVFMVLAVGTLVAVFLRTR